MVPSSPRAAKASVLEAMPAKAVPAAKPLLAAPDGAGAHWFGPLDPHTPPKNGCPQTMMEPDQCEAAKAAVVLAMSTNPSPVGAPLAPWFTEPHALMTPVELSAAKGFGGRNNLLEACSFGDLPIGAALDGVAPHADLSRRGHRGEGGVV